MLRQLRSADPDADVWVVVGYGAREVVTCLPDCRIIVNPFFDITGINASLWFARDAFDRSLMVLHGDLVLGEDLARDLLTAPADSLIAYDSSILDPKEINVAAEGGFIRRFGVNFAPYSGAYAGVLKLDDRAARSFAEVLDRRVCRGYNEARTYYFFVLRALLDTYGVVFSAFDFAGRGWKEIDYVRDIAAARALVGAEEER